MVRDSGLDRIGVGADLYYAALARLSAASAFAKTALALIKCLTLCSLCAFI